MADKGEKYRWPVGRYATERGSWCSGRWIGRKSAWKKKKKWWNGKGERKPVGRQRSVGTISADACSYAVRVLLSRAGDSCGIPTFVIIACSIRRTLKRRRARMQEEGTRREKGKGSEGGIGRRKEGRQRREPNQSSAWASHDIRSASGVMKSSSWRTSWLHFARIRRRRRASCNGKILYSAATERGASREARRSRYGLIDFVTESHDREMAEVSLRGDLVSAGLSWTNKSIALSNIYRDGKAKANE